MAESVGKSVFLYVLFVMKNFNEIDQLQNAEPGSFEKRMDKQFLTLSNSFLDLVVSHIPIYFISYPKVVSETINENYRISISMRTIS